MHRWDKKYFKKRCGNKESNREIDALMRQQNAEKLRHRKQRQRHMIRRVARQKSEIHVHLASILQSNRATHGRLKGNGAERTLCRAHFYREQTLRFACDESLFGFLLALHHALRVVFLHETHAAEIHRLVIAACDRSHRVVVGDNHRVLLVWTRRIAQMVQNSVAPRRSAEFLLGTLVVERGLAEVFVGGRKGDGRLDEIDESETGLL